MFLIGSHCCCSVYIHVTNGNLLILHFFPKQRRTEAQHTLFQQCLKNACFPVELDNQAEWNKSKKELISRQLTTAFILPSVCPDVLATAVSSVHSTDILLHLSSPCRLHPVLLILQASQTWLLFSVLVKDHSTYFVGQAPWSVSVLWSETFNVSHTSTWATWLP